MPRLAMPSRQATYYCHSYLRLLKMIEWYSALSDVPGVDEYKVQESILDMRIAINSEQSTMVLKAAAAVGHIKVAEVPDLVPRLIMLTPEGHDYIFRFTRSAETGTKWDAAFMGCNAPCGESASLFARKVY
jgi:hypothetical protein